MQEKIHPFSSLGGDVQKAIVPGYLLIHPETKNRIRALHGLVIKKSEIFTVMLRLFLFGAKSVRHQIVFGRILT